MRVAVLGAGNGGVASAFDFAQHGHDVALYAPPEFGENVVAVDRAGGIRSSGELERTGGRFLFYEEGSPAGWA